MTQGHSGRGKWGDPAVPKTGWSCVGIDDLEAPSEICQMCESMEIRYVHHMDHPDHPSLDVGCICAGHMEGDLEAARDRERWLRAYARRRATWDRRRWSRPTAGDLALNTDGYQILIYPVSGWMVDVLHRRTGRRYKGSFVYPSSEAARRASLKALLSAKDQMPAVAREDSAAGETPRADPLT